MTSTPAGGSRSPISQLFAAALDGDHRAIRVLRALADDDTTASPVDELEARRALRALHQSDSATELEDGGLEEQGRVWATGYVDQLLARYRDEAASGVDPPSWRIGPIPGDGSTDRQPSSPVLEAFIAPASGDAVSRAGVSTGAVRDCWGGVVELGEHWGYRSRSVDELVEVEVLRLGTKRPARVLVRFVDLDQEGREEWVPPARLKVPWSQAAQFIARDRLWDAARELSWHVRDEPEHYAVSQIIDDTYRRDGVSTGHRSADTGLLLVGDLDGLLADLGWDRSWFVEQPAVFYDELDQTWVAPWPVTEAVAQALAPLHAETLLAELADDERLAAREAIYGREYGRGKSAWSVSPERCAQTDAEFKVPIREVVRRWCGSELGERRDELEALRAEVGRLGALVGSAIEALRAAGEAKTAARLEKELGVQLPR